MDGWHDTNTKYDVGSQSHDVLRHRSEKEETLDYTHTNYDVGSQSYDVLRHGSEEDELWKMILIPFMT